MTKKDCQVKPAASVRIARSPSISNGPVRIAISPGRRFFILGNRRNELQHLQLSHGEFEPWHDEIIEIKDALELEYTEFFDDKVLRDNRRAIDEKIVAPLNKLWMSMFDQVPA